MDRARVVVTGASGFLGRHLIETLQGDFEVHAVARKSPGRLTPAAPCGVRWHFVDLTDEFQVNELIDDLRHDGGVEIVLHFAGYYDFTGESLPEYAQVNVEGTRQILRAAREWRARDFVYASSVAACALPRAGAALTEAGPADGPTPYGRSKRAAEVLVDEARDTMRCWIVRFSAVYSDWCEYEPLYRFLESWLLEHPRGRLLAGSGQSAIPYLHIRDAMSFVKRLLDRRRDLDCSQCLLASPRESTSHRELFTAATACHFGARLRPILLPKVVCRLGLRARLAGGRFFGLLPFERPWMADYIDRDLRVDPTLTWTRLGWRPRARFEVRRRMPFLIQNRKAFPGEWHQRNHARARLVRRTANLEIYRQIARCRGGVLDNLEAFVLDPRRQERFPEFQRLEPAVLRADGALLLDTLIDSVRAADQHLFRSSCRELALLRRSDRFSLDELSGLLNALGDCVDLALAPADRDLAWNLALIDHVTMTVQFGLDELRDVYDEMG